MGSMVDVRPAALGSRVAVLSLSAAVIVVVAGRSPAGGPAVPVGTVMASLQARYDDTASFRAQFRQQIVSVALGHTLEARGRVYYRRPGRMRWEFVGPDEQTVVADGTTLWVYQQRQKQVVRMELASAFQTTTPLSFLIGLGKLERDFDAELLPATAGSRLRLRLRPKAPGADVGSLELELAADTYDILGAVVTDATGGTTRWDFTDLERNVTLDDGLFRFVVPSGVDVVVPPS
jgi:outer membrane lipoprotein carrier protein